MTARDCLHIQPLRYVSEEVLGVDRITTYSSPFFVPIGCGKLPCIQLAMIPPTTTVATWNSSEIVPNNTQKTLTRTRPKRWRGRVEECGGDDDD
jgi:hypothetical protein